MEFEFIDNDPYDVDEIYQIPNIENYLDLKFKFLMFEKGDNTQIYRAKTEIGHYLMLEIISDESLITHEETVRNLINQDNIYYLSWHELLADETVITRFCYRPLVDTNDKNYYP